MTIKIDSSTVTKNVRKQNGSNTEQEDEQMEKQVVFIGGPHGAGKTRLCKYLQTNFGYPIVKQRHALIKIGERYGLRWPEVGYNHNELIWEVSKHVVQDFLLNDKTVLLVDCHYAVRIEKALRTTGSNVDARYIHDLDPRFVAVLDSRFKTKFVLLAVNAEIALSRFDDRPAELLDYDNTYEGLVEQSTVEEEFLGKLCGICQIQNSDILFLDNNNDFEQVIARLIKFVAI